MLSTHPIALFRVALILLAAAICVLLLPGCSSHEPPPIDTPSDPGALRRGRELTRGLASCGVCHGERPTPNAVLSGGQIVVDRYGSVVAPNITPAASGIGDWSDAQVADAIRSSVRPDGEEFSMAAHGGYTWLSDNDVFSIVAYLQSLAPVQNEVERRTIGTFEQYTTGLFEKRKRMVGIVPDLDRSNVEAYGQYLVDHVARCGMCHNREGTLFSDVGYLEGGQSILQAGREFPAPNITASEVSGIGDWKVEDIVQYLRTGRTKEDRQIDPKRCPTNFYRNADQADLIAIARYLKTVGG